FADDRVLKPPRAADIAERGLSIMQADAYVKWLLCGRLALPVPAVEAAHQMARAGDGICGVARARPWRAECRHDPVADVFVERTLVGEHRLFDKGVKAAQEFYDFSHRRGRAHRSEIEYVGKQHRDRLRADIVELAAGAHQLLDHVGRKVAGEHGAL